MRILSDACEYALRAVVWLAQSPDRTAKVRDIAEGTRSAPGYLVKVLQSLTRAGILSARRGNTGGFTLRLDPATLTVLEIVNAVDPIERIHTCPLGLKAHGTHLCPMHRRIDDVLDAIESTFGTSTIEELITTPSPSIPLRESLPANPGV